MKQTLLFFLLFFTFTLNAQVSLKLTVPDAALDVMGNEDEVIAKGTLTNEATDTVRVRWSRNVIELFDGWLTAVCDDNLCYDPSIEDAPQDLVIPPGESSQFNVYIYPLGFSGGSAIVEVTATDINDANNTVTGRYEFNTSTTSTAFIATPEIKIFPNPTTDFISLTETKYIERLVVYNIVGRPVRVFESNYNNTYNVSDLPTGMYLVRLMGKNDKTIKTVRLSKRGGA